MPLFIQDTVVSNAPRSVKDFQRQYDVFNESSKALTKQKAEKVGPEGLLYVGQREYAGTTPDDGKSG
jgi:protein N-terminal asparagine amidohydrolase